MNIKRYALTAIVLFVFTTAFDFLVHGILLKEAYTSTSNLWRPEAEMESYMGLMFLTQLAFSAAFAFIFTRNYEGRGIGEGARYGLYLGGLLAILEVQRYCYLPVPFSLPLSWALSAIVWGVLAGVILSLLYREEAPA